VTMDDLAEELGISKKTLYAHFPGKLDLLEAVLADKFAGVGSDAEGSYARASGRFSSGFAGVVGRYAPRIG